MTTAALPRRSTRPQVHGRTSVCADTDKRDGRAYFCTLAPTHTTDHQAGVGRGLVAHTWPRVALATTAEATS